MSKEKPIGLLVGLVFILMFGLVLSELTGTRSVPPAPAAAEENVESYSHLPAVEEYAPALPPPGGGVAMAGPAGGTAAVAADAVAESHLAAGPSEREGIIDTDIHRPTTVLAAVHGTAGGRADVAVADTAPLPPGPAGAAGPPTRVYRVELNDNLYRIARKVYGMGNERHYRLIYEANRRTMADERTLSVGQELAIPPLPAAVRPGGAAAPAPAGRPAPAIPAAPSVPAGTERRPSAPRTVSPPAPPVPPALADGRSAERPARYVEVTTEELGRRLADGSTPARVQRLYTVQRGDSLCDIARRVLGDDSPTAVRRLFNANRDRLDRPDRLPVGVRLNVPS